ncbi:hypothetical protein SAMN04487948_12012 [Halogranum amylolyticum]|uniref:Uncharacterized protein n=1 Tax=Halogranum amylolyticum TaxID=660520 RepID=A0A1H8VVM0_9EURY|nr:hypothetical protein [Halogranum amylolyticum]SEP19374.1 hypothetical protein SAMN04487948_12012 [Halogranum amylolyticum]
MNIHGPVWTDQPSRMRILDPLGTEGTINRLQSRLLYPVSSIAITERLRYLSFWAWITDHLDRHTRDERQRYEKIYLFANVAHDCDDEGTHGQGIVSRQRELDDGRKVGDIYDPTVDTVNISNDNFTLTSNSSGFDQYYKGILYNLLLFENEWTLSPLGKQLAVAFDEAISVEFSELQSAVEAERVQPALIERFAEHGCLCQLSNQEREYLTKAFLGLYTPETTWEDLDFLEALPVERLNLAPFLDRENLAESLIAYDEEDASTARLDVMEAREQADLTDLEKYILSGQHVFTRTSLLLILYAGYWVTERPTKTPDFTPLAESRALWQLVIHTEYFSQACQALLIGFYEAVRMLEPIGEAEVIERILTAPEYREALEAGLAAEVEPSDGELDTRAQIKNSIYYGQAFETSHRARLTPENDTQSLEEVGGKDSWEALTTVLTSGADALTLGSRSEWAFRTLLQDALEDTPSLAKSARVFGYSTLLLSSLQARYQHDFSADEFAPYRQWFNETERYPSPALLWNFPYDPSQTVATVLQQFTDDHIYTQYFNRLYQKLADNPGKSPQLMSTDADGQLSYVRPFNGGTPNLPTLKYDRLGDIFFELGWTTGNSLRELTLTTHGQALLEKFYVVGDR